MYMYAAEPSPCSYTYGPKAFDWRDKYCFTILFFWMESSTAKNVREHTVICLQGKNKLNIIADGHNNEGDEAEEDGHRDGERIRQPRAPSAIALVIGLVFALTVIILMGFDVFGANLYSVDTQRNVSHASQIMSGLQYPGMVIAVLIGVHAVWDAIPQRVCTNIYVHMSFYYSMSPLVLLISLLNNLSITCVCNANQIWEPLNPVWLI